MVAYITLAQLKPLLFQAQDTDDGQLSALCDRVSRVFDLACERSADYFAPASNTATVKQVRGTGDRVLRTGLFVPGSVASVEMPTGYDAPEFYEGAGSDSIWIKRGVVPAPSGFVPGSEVWPDEELVGVTARWGFPAVPGDVVQACLEIAVKTWRARDTAFGRILDIDSNKVITDDIPPLAKMIVNKWSARRAPVFA